MKKILLISPLMALLVAHGHCQTAAKPQSFEVFSIKPCTAGTPEPPAEHMGMVQFVYPGGRFNGKATTVKYLLEWAYDILPAQHSSGPAWMGSDRYDIDAKAQGAATESEMKLLTQALLADQFKLKAHRENKEMPVLVLSTGKAAPKVSAPKDDDKRGMRIVPQKNAEGKVTSYRLEATRFSIAQLSQTFSRNLGRIILNETGLTGDYNFNLEFTPDESHPNPMDPALMFDAMQKQLGLVVKAQKAAVDYLVIESVEKVAASN
jgi:Protein of unknown function (DUF3738).